MTEISLDMDRVLANARLNKQRGWTFGPRGASAAERLQSGKPLDLRHRPKFTLDSDHPIFTIGSCFARNIENLMISRNLPIVLKNFGTPPEMFANWDEKTGKGGGTPKGLLSRTSLNKFSVHSMTHELRRVLGGASYPNEGLIELAHGKWFDPHASRLHLLPYEVALENRRVIHHAMSQIKRAKVVIMTLGLTETWIDAATGLAINEPPGATWLARCPGRWNFVDFGYDAILEEMSAFIALARERADPDMKFIVTVSPVPLGATAKDQDIIVASNGSKSTLRAVAEELYRRHDFVDYFPSYEYAMFSHREIVWKEDQLHVQRPFVEHITRSFIDAYYSESGDCM
jgi:hypothetical protein